MTLAPTARRRLAVLGSPIVHSKSPAMHSAAYRVLGLDWEYGRAEVRGDGLGDFIAALGDDWRGLSLTMPLKRDVLPLLVGHDDVVELTGAANTVLIGDDGLTGYNTDVAGIVAALGTAGITRLGRVRMLGAGATASSALVAVAQLGARTVEVSTRTVANAAELVSLAERLKVRLTVRALGEDFGDGAADGTTSGDEPDLVVSTVPGSAQIPIDIGRGIRSSVPLFDVAYDQLSSATAAWNEAGGVVVDGLEMLIAQALCQVRIFVGGSAQFTLPAESDVVAAIRAAARPTSTEV